LSFIRRDKNGGPVIVALNLTPVPRHDYRLGVPLAGHYKEIMNTDSETYGGSNIGNGDSVDSEEQAWMDQPHSVSISLPPLSCVILRPQS